ncbi:predicted protein [Plenodomus lingam JN3]|uniref:Uncharacterized protein n=1 Tax=Leptosphaeria maculans (strain JN3 / isolate v23.1.3 / race Av1-4-5-6-7-8) TaxID=985895 RepID=M1ZJG5_LEPMJ|nr:predicted protein [Plenodomus lingam JN3]
MSRPHLLRSDTGYRYFVTASTDSFLCVSPPCGLDRNLVQPLIISLVQLPAQSVRPINRWLWLQRHQLQASPLSCGSLPQATDQHSLARSEFETRLSILASTYSGELVIVPLPLQVDAGPEDVGEDYHRTVYRRMGFLPWQCRFLQ